MMSFEEANKVLNTFSKIAKLYRDNVELSEIKVVKLGDTFLTQNPLKANDVLLLDNRNYKVLSVAEGPNQLYFEAICVLNAYN